MHAARDARGKVIVDYVCIDEEDEVTTFTSFADVVDAYCACSLTPQLAKKTIIQALVMLTISVRNNFDFDLKQRQTDSVAILYVVRKGA